MALWYTTYRDNRETSNNFYYGRAVHLNEIGLDEMAEKIQAKCSMRKSDVMAVLVELFDVMNDELRNSNIVVWPKIGRFKMNIVSKGVEQEEDYSVDCIRRTKILFSPERKRRTDGSYTRAMSEGIVFKKVKFAPTNDANSIAEINEEGEEESEP